MATEAKERRKIYLERKEQKCCPRCGIKMKRLGKFTYCEGCRNFFREYNRDNSDNINKTRKTLYEQRKEKNCCPRCGKRHLKRYKKIMCAGCLDKAKQYSNKKIKIAKKASRKNGI